MAEVVIRPITPSRLPDVEALFRTSSITRTCWDIWPRYTAAEGRERAARLTGREHHQANRDEFRALARRRRAPGLLAYAGGQAVGFISLGPRAEMRRIEGSRATPRVDDLAVWVVPCFYIHPKHRRRGIGVALLRAAVDYASRHGAPAVEGYPRAPGMQVHDDFAFFGTVEMFRRAGYRAVRRPAADLPKGWVPRYTMRAPTGGRPVDGAKKQETAPARGRGRL